MQDIDGNTGVKLSSSYTKSMVNCLLTLGSAYLVKYMLLNEVIALNGWLLTLVLWVIEVLILFSSYILILLLFTAVLSVLIFLTALVVALFMLLAGGFKNE